MGLLDVLLVALSASNWHIANELLGKNCLKVVMRHCSYAGVLVMIVLLVLTPVFKYMPNNAQGAIIIAAVIGLFNYTEWLFLWKV